MRESYLIRKYKEHLISEKLSTSTVDNYLVDALTFLHWLCAYLARQSFRINSKQPATYIAYVNKRAVSDFAKELALKNAAGATIKRKIAGLRKFLDFAVGQGYLIKNPAEDIQIPKSNNLKEVLSEFRKWIGKKGATDTTIKNYVSDIRHFIKSVQEISNVQNYLNNIQKQYSTSSYKRKLSSLRQFIAFLEVKGRIDKEKARKLQRVLDPKRVEVAPHPPAGGSKISTSRFTLPILAFLFLSINIFFLGKIKSQILNNITDAVSKESAPEENLKAVKLPLSAILTDNYNIPLSYEQDISFSIYPSENSSNPIYSTGRCNVLPDNNGKIKITIGQDCGRPIPYNIFKDNLELYLGVSLGFGSELLPRTAIKRLNPIILKPTAMPTATPIPSPFFSNIPIASPSVSLIEENKESTPSNTID